MSRVRTPQEERNLFERFLLAHSGHSRRAQCGRHPAIAKMTYPQLARVMEEELGFVRTRQSVAKACRELGVSRRRPGSAPLSDEKRRRANGRRWQRWHDRMVTDPKKEKAYRERKREAGRRQEQKLRMNPVAWEAFLKRRREYLRDYRRRQREAAAVA